MLKFSLYVFGAPLCGHPGCSFHATRGRWAAGLGSRSPESLPLQRGQFGCTTTYLTYVLGIWKDYYLLCIRLFFLGLRSALARESQKPVSGPYSHLLWCHLPRACPDDPTCNHSGIAGCTFKSLRLLPQCPQYRTSSAMSPSHNTRLVLAERPTAHVTPSTFRKEVVPFDPKAGPGEIVVKVEYVSIDPAMRSWLNDGRSYIEPVKIGEAMRALGLGVVIQAGEGSKLAPGDHVTGTFGESVHAPAVVARLMIRRMAGVRGRQEQGSKQGGVRRACQRVMHPRLTYLCTGPLVGLSTWIS